MDTPKIILFICTCIELYHLLFRKQILGLTKPISEVQNNAKKYKDFIEELRKFTESYISDESLRNYIGVNITENIAQVIKSIECLATPNSLQWKKLNEFGYKKLVLYLLQQLVEAVYWLLWLTFPITIPNVGLSLFVILAIMTLMDRLIYFENYNKYNKFLKINKFSILQKFYIFDSLLCISIYTITVIYYV